MILLPNLLIVTGNARNVGKTTLANAIIRHFSEAFPIIGLKVSAMRTDDEDCHGEHPEPAPASYRIDAETDRSGSTDTSRMLLAGARQAWFIRAHEMCIEKAVSEFLTMIPSKALIVAESRALRLVAEPSALILIERRPPWPGLKPIDSLIPLSSMHLLTGPGYAPLPEIMSKITTNGKNWVINP